MLIVTGFVTVPPAELPSFSRDLAELGQATRLRAGCLDYSAALDDASIGRWLVVERWEDERALKAHLAAPDTVAFVERWGDRMTSEVRLYDVTGERMLTDDR